LDNFENSSVNLLFAFGSPEKIQFVDGIIS
jgi:hypothetical protein